jgi:leucyl/phenylalanyl-tRNA--protein transferase
VNTAFQQVLGGCAAIINRGSQRDTWITDEVREGYFELHKAGFCHSVECWENNELSGGLYGVAIGGMFAGESMFFRRAEASKLCLLFLIEYLHKNDVPWIDCQQLTPLLERFGAVQVPRERFLGLLKTAINREITLFREFS